ncbi:defense against restriction DarA-related protein [Robertmurraya siralis]|uniref:defense against restriction DarA-related protein n=1 Tax=Robertmurraya siralis TaxID=77777 RepID=UPI0010F8C829|nr:hypothetical protein [Robertmurraya siralis]
MFSTNPAITSLSKWKEGKDYTITYAIEHTKHDPELEEINYSNLIREEFKDLEQTLYFLNIYQQQGYQNITIMYTVYNKDGQHIIEDYVSEIDITLNSKHQEETNKRNKELTKVIEEQQKELELYKQFLTKYNSIKLFEKFKKESNIHWYAYRLRGFSLGCQPKGHIKVDHSKGRHGIIAYDRELTQKELDDYELIPYTEAV